MRNRYPVSRRRTPGTPLTAGAHETLVYRVGDRHVTGAVDPTQADAVSVVDLREVRVTVRRLRRHLGLSGFRITGTFHCAVVDPVAVVQNGRTFTIRQLRRLIVKDIREAGFDLNPARDLQDVLRTWYQRRPSPIPGVRVTLMRVHVRRPVERVEYDDYTEA